MFTFLYTHIRTCMNMYLYMCTYMYICIYACMKIYKNIPAPVHQESRAIFVHI